MSVTVNFECGGCFDKAKGIKPLRRRFESFRGRLGGWGTYKTDTVEDVAPEGWVVYDPYTHCCYCPKCWAEIEGDS